MQKVVLAFVTVALVLPSAHATDPPEVKEGLWTVHSELTNNPGGKKIESNYTICRDHEFDQIARDREKGMKGCTTVGETLQDGKYTSEIHCSVKKTTIDSKGITTYTGDSAFHSETHVAYTPALGGVSESIIVVDQKYAGSCPAGTQPGDRTNEDGTVLHLGKQ